MLHTAQLSRDIRANVARQIAAFWPRTVVDSATGMRGRASMVFIAETLQVWTIDVLAPRDLPTGTDLRVAARPTRRYHHQLVNTRGTAVGFARTVRTEAGEVIVTEAYRAVLARKIALQLRRLGKISRRMRGDIRLLLCPARFITALWVVPDDPLADSSCLIASAPPRFTLGRKGVIHSEPLLAALRRRRPEMRRLAAMR